MEAMARKGRLPAERRQAAARRAGLAAWSIVRGILLAGICFVVLFPLFSKVSRSFMAVEDLYNLTVRYIPAHFTLQNYQLMWAWMDMPKTLFTTLGISLLVAFCQTAAATWVGYGFARFKFRGRNALFIGLIVCMVVPPDLMLMPLYLIFQGLHMIDTPLPFVLMGLTCTGLKKRVVRFPAAAVFPGDAEGARGGRLCGRRRTTQSLRHHHAAGRGADDGDGVPVFLRVAVAGQPVFLGVFPGDQDHDLGPDRARPRQRYDGHGGFRPDGDYPDQVRRHRPAHPAHGRAVSVLPAVFCGEHRTERTGRIKRGKEGI